MRIWLPLYARREDGLHAFRTLGLGALNGSARARHAGRAKRDIAERLQRQLRQHPAEVVKLLERRPGMKLERLRMELRVGRGRRRSGMFPLILEPIATVGEPARIIVYHPYRQTDALLTTAAELRDEAPRFFAHAWGALADEALEALQTDGKDRLEAFATNLHPQDLLDRLPEKERSVFADLEAKPRQRGASEKRERRRGVPKILQDLGEDWTALAADEMLPLGRPRDRWRTRLAQLLCVDHPRPLVLIGDVGCGKRTLLRRATDDLLRHDGFDTHRNIDEVRHVIELAASRLIAGMSYVGDWEQRCSQILDATQKGRFLLAFQDLHTLGRVGQSRDSSRSVADFFRGPLGRREVVLLGTATDSQWRRLEEDAPSFAAAFTVLRIDPATREETMGMMLHEVGRVERERHLAHTPQALFDILDIGAPLLDTALPGGALDLLQEASRGLSGGTASQPTEIDSEMVLSAIAQRTGLAVDLIDNELELPRDEALEFLEARVMGQSATEAVADLILRIRSSMTDPARPMGTYLFTGPTGTGKTELAKALAAFLYPDDDGERLVRFDMGELSGPDAPARLVGDRFEPRGLLTEAVRRRPFCVLLLDEIEKAHPSVLHLLLQILEDGRLTDAAGDRADFRHAVIVLTSNLGAKTRPSVGFGESARSDALDVARAVRDFFPPELFNRIERIVPFSPLDEETAEKIAVKELALLLGRRGLTDRNVFVSASPSAVEQMAHAAFDSRAGARSVRRYLEKEIAPVLADHLASTARPELELVRIRHAGDGYALTSDPLVEAEALPGRSPLTPLLDAHPVTIAKELPQALAWLEEVESQGELERLSEKISSHLARFDAEGRASDADAVVHLSGLRDELARFREHLEAFVHYDEQRAMAEYELAVASHDERVTEGDLQRVRLLHPRWLLPPMPRQEPKEMLAALAEVGFVRRLLSEPLAGSMKITIELTGIGSHRGRRLGLAGQLAELYRAQRGELTQLTAIVDGEVRELPLDTQLFSSELALTLVGPGLESLWAAEDGCHVWTRSDGASEVVRVRIHPGRDATEVLQARLDAQAAVARGEDQEPVDSLGQAVRRIKYDGGRGDSRSHLLVIEDFRLGEVFQRHTSKLRDGLESLLWLRMTWRDEEPTDGA
ncbi:MAG: ATP-dependent Clp protease ATP-binding subunit [Deltaproteobacteria bacterium]|nr:ATP-dependent Clp protease ATP-binding subunit [Deltaproteobacteria bacterium]